MSVAKQNRLLVFLKDPRKKNYLLIFKEAMTLLFLKKEIPFYYFKYLYRKRITNYKDYLSTKEGYKIKYNPKFHRQELMDIISNKLNFALYFEKNGFPVPKLTSYNFKSDFYYQGQCFAVKTKADIIEFFSMVFAKTGQDKLFVKPVALCGGEGCYRIDRDHIEASVSESFEFIMENYCIHQESVVQHDKINKIHAACVNTIRAETFIDKNGKIQILSALMRFGIGNNYVDNAHTGGIFVGIDLENGRLKELGHQHMNRGGAEFYAHPNSNVIFSGYEIPYFKEICNLLYKSVNILPDRFIGWDIAISTNGPVIIEANENPSVFMSEITYGGYMKHPIYKEVLEEI